MASSRKLRFLTALQLERIHKTFVNSNTQLLQPGYLQSAAHGPINAKHYNQQEDIFRLAANLSEKIIKNHAFMDGNKRTAMAAADMFLKLNGYQLQNTPLSPAETNNTSFVNAHLAMVTNQWTVEQLAEFYRKKAQPFENFGSAMASWRDEAEEH